MSDGIGLGKHGVVSDGESGEVPSVVPLPDEPLPDEVEEEFEPLDVDPPPDDEVEEELDPPDDEPPPDELDVASPATVTTTAASAFSYRAEMREAPLVMPVIHPSASIFATDGVSTDQSVLDVTSSWPPSANRANDRNCTRDPRDNVDVPAIEILLTAPGEVPVSEAAKDDGAVAVTRVPRLQLAEIVETTAITPMTYLIRNLRMIPIYAPRFRGACRGVAYSYVR